MAPVSMVLHVSYMRSVCSKEWRTGRQMISWAVRHGVAEECIQICVGLRVVKRSRIALDRICKVVARKQWLRWLTNFSKEACYIWPGMRCMALPQASVPSGESTIAVMQADSRKLVHTGPTKPSRLFLADRGALHFRKLLRSIVRPDIVVWVDNSSMPSFGQSSQTQCLSRCHRNSGVAHNPPSPFSRLPSGWGPQRKKFFGWFLPLYALVLSPLLGIPKNAGVM